MTALPLLRHPGLDPGSIFFSNLGIWYSGGYYGSPYYDSYYDYPYYGGYYGAPGVVIRIGDGGRRYYGRGYRGYYRHR